MDYVRLDNGNQYIYFENDTKIQFERFNYRSDRYQTVIEYRSQYTLKTNYKCNRMTRKKNIPADKKCCVWYSKDQSK